MKQSKWHPTITIERVIEAAKRQQVTLDDPGFCLACGEETTGVEPDARKHECDHCGAHQVYGAAEIVLMMV